MSRKVMHMDFITPWVGWKIDVDNFIFELDSKTMVDSFNGKEANLT